MELLFNTLVLVTSIIILVYAYFKGSDLGKLIIYILFAAVLLSEFIGILVDISIFDFLANLLNQVKGLIPLLEIILIVIVTFFKGKNKPNRILFSAIIILLAVKLIGYFL